MKIPTVLLFLLIATATILKTDAIETAEKIEAMCKDIIACPNAPFCFAYSKPESSEFDACKPGIKTNEECSKVPFGLITNTAAGKYKVQLVGPVAGGAGWIGIGFAKKDEIISTVDAFKGEFGFVCQSDPMQVHLVKAPISSNTPGAKVPGGEVAVKKPHIVCEFELTAAELNQLKTGDFKIVLFGNMNAGAQTKGKADHISSSNAAATKEVFDTIQIYVPPSPPDTGLDGAAASLAAGLILIGFSLILSGIGQQC